MVYQCKIITITHTNLGYSELDDMKTEANDNRDYQGVLKERSEDVIPAPVEPQGQITRRRTSVRGTKNTGTKSDAGW